MNFKFKHKGTDQAELDVTSFMNLMIVLVPVLLLSMTFTQVTVLDIELPELTGGASKSDAQDSQLEVHVNDDGFRIFYPSSTLVYTVPKLSGTPAGAEGEQIAKNNIAGYDYRQLSLVLREMKKQLKDKQDVVLLSSPDTSYQHLVFTMETLKSYQTTVAASLVEVELFPEISLGDTK